MLQAAIDAAYAYDCHYNGGALIISALFTPEFVGQLKDAAQNDTVTITDFAEMLPKY